MLSQHGIIVIFLLSLIVHYSNGLDQPSFAGQADLVGSLSGIDFKLSFRHYSGYLEPLSGTALHYWFFESQSSHPEKDPVVLWLNGGPGCSSLLGALAGIGPLRVDRKSGDITLNPFSWNQKANLLFLESPAGVGFSYKLNGNYSIDDHETARLNFDAVSSFFAKFPHLTENAFYITGESYAGVYVPTLSVLALEHRFPKNFRGVAIGNGFLDENLIANSVFYFMYYHGMIDSVGWESLVTNCCTSIQANKANRCNFWSNQTPKCMNIYMGYVGNLLQGKLGINSYNIYGTCDSGQAHQNVSSTKVLPSVSVDSVTRKLLFDAFGFDDEQEDYYEGSQLGKSENPPCVNYDSISTWLNSAQVQKALHIDSSLQAIQQVLPWGPCRELNYVKQIKSVKQHISTMVDSGLKVLIYNGDVDSNCNFIGDSWFVQDLGYKVRIAHHPWMFAGQVAGFATFYDKQLTFTTIRGAGHMVPEDKPAEALQMFTDFLGASLV